MSAARLWRILGMVLLSLSLLACGERPAEVDPDRKSVV